MCLSSNSSFITAYTLLALNTYGFAYTNASYSFRWPPPPQFHPRLGDAGQLADFQNDARNVPEHLVGRLGQDGNSKPLGSRAPGNAMLSALQIRT